MTPRPRRPSLDELAAGPVDDTDRAALAAMADLYRRTDPVPDGLVERIRFGLTLDALHAEIAELQRTGDLVGARSDDTTQASTITFTSASLTTMITVTPVSADRVRVDGWAAPGGGVGVELRVVGDSRYTTADANGRFVFEQVPRGLAQFVLRPPAGTFAPPVVTPSVEI